VFSSIYLAIFFHNSRSLRLPFLSASPRRVTPSTFSVAHYATLSCHPSKQRVAQILIHEAFELQPLSVSRCGKQRRYLSVFASRVRPSAVEAVRAGRSLRRAIVLTRPQVPVDSEHQAPVVPAPLLVFGQAPPTTKRRSGSVSCHSYAYSHLSWNPRLCSRLGLPSAPLGLFFT